MVIVLRVNKIPMQYDESLANQIRIMLTFVVVWHLGISFLMMSNESIFPLHQTQQIAKYHLPSVFGFIDETRLNLKHA